MGTVAVNCVQALVIARSTHARNCLRCIIFMITSNSLILANSCTDFGTVNGSVACAVTRLGSAMAAGIFWEVCLSLRSVGPGVESLITK